MKQGKPLITFVIAAIAVVLAIYLGVYAFRAFDEPFRTALVYTYTAEDSVEADGLLIRDEVVFPAQSGIVELTRSEGEKVGVGQTVALIYKDSQAQSDQAQIQRLSQEIKLLQYAMGQSGSVESAARLDENILKSMVALRSSSALGNYSNLEEQILTVKSDILKRGYTYGDGLTAADLNTQLQTLNSQLASLNQRSSSATTRVTASQSGIFSSLVDGYESLLTPAKAMELTPSALSTLMAQPETSSTSTTGKLIVSNGWYFAASLPLTAVQRLQEGSSALLRFSGDFSEDVDMTVVHISEAENDQAVVVFSTDKYLSRTTLLRRQTAELIFDSWSGLRIPKTALRLVEEEYKDSETEELVQTTRLGVYAIVNGRTEFKEVDVIIEGSDYYIVSPVGSGRTILRAGDEIISQATGLADGQLVTQ